jgi:hypothetical protein
MSEAAYDIQVHLERWRDHAQGAVDTFAALRQKAEESSRRLESPSGVLQFIDFFSTFFADAAEVFERVRAELEQAPLRVHAEALRQVASNAALEQRRCLQFRDKWINRPLPYEDVRPLLTDIVNTAADRLPGYRDVNPIADELDVLVRLIQPPSPKEETGPLDRRQLFTKWFGR